jgi:peptidylamidoglycolate lyase
MIQRLPLFVFLSAVLGVAQSEPGGLSYQVDAEWPSFPAGINFGPAASVDTDRIGNTYIFRRVEPPVLVFDKNGAFSRAFGSDLFTNPHGIRIDPDGNVWGVDDGSHVAIKMSPSGRVLMVLGRQGFKAKADNRFDGPSDIGFGPGGELYVADGNNARIVKFSKEGRFLKAWGQPGSGEGEFSLPHGIAVDKQGLVYVCDRENLRVQIFDAEGKFLRQWKDAGTPFGIDIAEDQSVYIGDARGHRFLKFSPDGTLVGSYGEEGEMPGQFGLGPHHLAVASDGTVYTTEIPNLRVQKFVLKGVVSK